MHSLMLSGGGTHYAAGNGVFQILKYDTNAGSSTDGTNITVKKYLYAAQYQIHRMGFRLPCL
jgi:hypothetical protein